MLRLIAPHGGKVTTGKSVETVDRTLLTTRSVEFDAVLVAGGSPGLVDIKLDVLLQEVFRHAKPIGAWGDGVQCLQRAGIPVDAAGVLVATQATAAQRKDLVWALGLHRVWGARSPLNEASAKTMTAAGMVEEGTIREHILKAGKWRDSVVHAMLDREWRPTAPE